MTPDDHVAEESWIRKVNQQRGRYHRFEGPHRIGVPVLRQDPVEEQTHG